MILIIIHDVLGFTDSCNSSSQIDFVFILWAGKFSFCMQLSNREEEDEEELFFSVLPDKNTTQKHKDHFKGQ